MGLLKKAKNQQAYGKISLQGFAKAGKTFTAIQIAIGIAQMINSKKDIAFLDTETGSDFMISIVKKAGFDLIVAKTRAFKDLIEITKEAEKEVDILIVDSISHIWMDLIESYLQKKNKRTLAFQDWGIIKPTWRQYTDLFLTSKLHVICCGRAAFEWDYFENEEGKMELYKKGTKMRAETEFSYEPSLLVEMERIKEKNKFIHRATILGDRSDLLDGKHYDNPSFDFFKPHFQFLNLGGEHNPLDITRTSEDMFDKEGKPEWKKEKELKQIKLEEIDAIYTKYFPGSTAKEKKAKADLAEEVFKTRSWTSVTLQSLEQLNNSYITLENILSTPQNIKILLGEAGGEIIYKKKDKPPGLTKPQKKIADIEEIVGKDIIDQAWEECRIKPCLYRELTEEQCNNLSNKINVLVDSQTT